MLGFTTPPSRTSTILERVIGCRSPPSRWVSIDISDTSIVNGNRSGSLRFRTDRVTRTNIVLENATFPKPTPLETIDVPAPGKAFEVDEPTPSQPAGCEAAASLITDPTLARLVGRCFA